MVSDKLHEIVYFGQGPDFSRRKKQQQQKKQFSCKYAHLHSISLSTAVHKVSRNAVEQFTVVAMTNYFSSTFKFGKISKFKRGVTSLKK